MKKYCTLFTIYLFLATTGTVLSQTNTWTGLTSTLWTVPTNWSLGHVPNSGENVVITSVPVNQPVLSGATGVCNMLTVNSGASLTLSATSPSNALLTASGSATISGSLSIGGTPLKTAKLIVVNITWASGSSMAGFFNGSLEVSGNWEFSAGSAVSMGYSRVTFTGSTNTEIISKSSNSIFSGVTVGKSSGNTISISSASTATLNFTGAVTINSGSTLIGQANITTIFGDNVYNTGHFSFNSGTASFEKSTGIQAIQVNSGDIFNNLTINGGATVTVNNYLQVLNDVTIQSGVFDPLGNVVVLFGDWFNAVGPAGFAEGTGRVVFSGGNYHQYSSTETFNILEVHKAIGGAFRVNGTSVTCAQYDWTAGSVDVLNNGTFTANDLADNGIYGGFYINPGCTINLHQDIAQFVDLGATLNFNGGGTINIYGGSSMSVWAFNDDATITMNGGTLDFKNQGIKLLTAVPYTLTTSITGGTIRTTGDYYSNRAGFNPAGGTIELYGGTGKSLEVTAGSVRNLSINKDPGVSVTLVSNLTVNGNLTVDNGGFIADNKVITQGGNLNINDYGLFHIGPGSQLKMSGNMSIIIGNGGILETYGNGADNAEVTHSAGYYYLDVQPGGTISSRYTTFQYSYRLLIGMNGIIDPANAFYHCTFTNFSTSSFLSIQNTQTISLHAVNFPTLPPVNNVTKGNNAGNLYFKDATGAYAGPAYEYDPYNRIHWSSSTPGLWTGEISSDWYAPQNWDNYAVPVSATNVTIPAGTSFSPEVNSGDAYCNNITVQSGAKLSVGAGDLNLAGDMTVYGQVEETNANANIYVAGSVIWESGSTANIIAGAFNVQEDWEFRNGSNAQLANGTVYFEGPSTAYIRCFESNAAFNNVYNIKTSGSLYFSNTSTDSLKINGALNNQYETSVFYGNSTTPLILKGQLFNTGHIYCPFGTFILKGTTKTINLSTGDYFNNLIFNSSGDITLADSLRIHGNLTVESGALVTNNYPVMVGGNWTNNVGTGGFQEGTGLVTFEGSTASDILTGETFYNLLIEKSYVGADGVEINDSVASLSNVIIQSGTLEMNPGSRLFIGNQLMISTGAGLNADDADVEIYSAEDWYDSNISATTTTGFKAGNSSVVHFLGKPANTQTIQEKCPFNDVFIANTGNYARPEFYNMSCKNLVVSSGTFRLAGYKVTVSGDFTVGLGTLYMNNASDSLVVTGNITWESGSNDMVTAGRIFAGNDWVFQNGTNASLGTGNTVIFNRIVIGSIYCLDPDAAFGNLVVDKTPGVEQSLLIHGSSTDTMRVSGTMTVFTANTLWLQNNRLIVDGNLDIRADGQITMATTGFLLNNHPSFLLNGQLVCNGEVVVHGTFEQSVTGELYVNNGLFTSDAPRIGAGDWQYLRGLVNIGPTGILEIANNSIWIASTFRTTAMHGKIITGTSFNATSPGTFQPFEGTVTFTYSGAGAGYLYCSSGNYLNNLEVAGNVVIGTDVTVKNDVMINSGYLSSSTNDLYVQGDWTNNVGPGGFYEYTNTVFFAGANDADILTNETFYNVAVAKTNTNPTALELMNNITMNVGNDLNINDGAFKLNSNSTLDINRDLVIVGGAGLNAIATALTINIAGDWVNNNTGYAETFGFNPGGNSLVTFNGTTDQLLTTASPQEDFYNLRIFKTSGEFRPNDNLRCFNDIEILNGAWEDQTTGLHHKVYGDFSVSASGAFLNAFPLNTVEFSGVSNSLITYTSTTGCFHNLVVTKNAGVLVTLATNVSCLFEGDLTVENGMLNLNSKTLWVEGNIDVNSNGVLSLPAASVLVLTNANSLNVNPGGRLDIAGTAGNPATLQADMPTAHYSLSVNSGGTIAADYGIFKNTGLNGVNVVSGGIVDLAHSFKGCTFQDGSAGGTLLTLNNSQTLTIRSAMFPANAGGGATNVTKTLNSGHVYFVDYSGLFSGSTYENDAFNLIDWVPTLTATATAAPGSVCAGSGSQLNVNRAGGLAPFTYLWFPASGLSNPAIINPFATPLASTNYTVTVTDALGSIAASSILVTVVPVLPVSITIAASANPSPPGNFVTFAATPVNGGSSPAYQWQVNGIGAGTGLPTYSYIPSNGDEVACVLTSNVVCASGNPATSNMIQMAVLPAAVSVAGTVSPGMTNCYNAFQTITVSDGGSGFVVESGGSATFIAGLKISYLPGTWVQHGGYMLGYITTTNEYCGTLSPAMVSAITREPEQPEPYIWNNFNVYPNPSSGKFTLAQHTTGDYGTVKVDIFSIRGERVVSTTMTGEQKRDFDLQHVAEGLYLVKVLKSDHFETMKLIINR